MSEFDFDFLVIGGGSGGVRAARMAAGLGARTGLIETDRLGGTCVNIGCVPKKLYYYASHLKEDIELATGFGWEGSLENFDWARLQQNKNREIERLNNIYGAMLTKAGVHLIDGFGTLEGPNTVRVGDTRYTANKILLATGGTPFVPNIPGAELGQISDDIFEWDTLPERLLIVGGGYIALEFACILHNLGVDVSISVRSDRVLNGFDGDIALHLKQCMADKGIRFLFDHHIEALTAAGDRIEVQVKGREAEHFDRVLFATGRRPRVDNLGLETTAVAQKQGGGILVNDDFQTDEPSVYAVGDIVDRMQLTPVALAEGMRVAHHLFGEQQFEPVPYQSIPTAIFTQPNVGTVGFSEEAARKAGHNVKVFQSMFTPMRLSFSDHKEKCFMKLVVDTDSDRVLGAHMVGPDAGEIMQGIGIAVTMGATKAQFDLTIGIHPTTAEEFVTMR